MENNQREIKLVGKKVILVENFSRGKETAEGKTNMQKKKSWRKACTWKNTFPKKKKSQW